MTEWRKRVKHALGVVIYRTGLHRVFLRKRGIIVLFHRVEDADPDNPLSCTRAEFEAFCRFFRRHFDVVPLSELLDRLERGAGVGGSAVITFDDGYLDNHRAAAPMLLRHGLPACFFIATGFIGSSAVPWWDAERGYTPAWMSWSDVRELVGMGFEVGAHTVNHVDLGQVHGAEARREIAGSGERLERELGVPVPLFSYPYGRRDQITEENRAVVRESGFRCCLSAFGGYVRDDSDPLKLRRLPISPWFISPYQLGWEILVGSD